MGQISSKMAGLMGNMLIRSLVYDIGIQWGLFAIAAFFQTEKFYDLAGSGTFIFLALQTLRWGETYFTRQKIQSGMVVVWGLRLGLFLFTRVLREGKDSRFDKVRGKPLIFFIYWTIQALWVWVTLAPTLILNSEKKDKELTTRDYVGWSLWAIGFLMEAISDYQKSSFRSNPDNATKFMSTGLWSISRHPNYFGEILLWSGLFVSASTIMSGYQYTSVLSPMFVAYLLIRVSGIPLLEKSALKRWGGNPQYQQYVKNTAVLIPFIW
ncbi:uncharacterized protein [Ptychodera flava]|uniref:uncharacterized protein n=1 Tax=Ptychodera flava TaxID=63121 RepID=UPI003969D958